MFGIIDWAAEERFALEQAEATPWLASFKCLSSSGGGFELSRIPEFPDSLQNGSS